MCARRLDRRWILEAESLKECVHRQLEPDGSAGGSSRRRVALRLRTGLDAYHRRRPGAAIGPQENFPGDRVNCFFEDHEGNWWAGLDAGGLVRIRERRFQTIDTGGQVSTKPARSVCEETNGTVWIGTLGDGLGRWQAGTYTNLTVPGGTGKGFAFCVCPDAAGRLWVSAGDEDLFVREHNGFQRCDARYPWREGFWRTGRAGSGLAPRAGFTLPTVNHPFIRTDSKPIRGDRPA
jgi:hypothetical protein